MYQHNNIYWWLVLWCKGARKPLKIIRFVKIEVMIHFDWLSYTQQRFQQLFIKKETRNVFCRRQTTSVPVNDLIILQSTNSLWTAVLILFTLIDTLIK